MCISGRSWILFSLLGVSACKKAEDSDTHNTETAPEDTEVQEETAVETDVSEIETATILGSLQYLQIENGSTICDLTTSFTGNSYAGDCSGCDFAFTIESTVQENEGSSPACQDSLNSFLALDSATTLSSYGHPLNFGFWTSYASYNGDTLQDLLAAGVDSYEYFSPAIDSLFYADTFFHYTGMNGTTFVREGDSLAWTTSHELTLSTLTGYLSPYECAIEGDYIDSTIHTIYEGTAHIDTIVAGSLTSEAEADSSLPGTPLPVESYGSRDVWTFSAEAGDSIQISADTIADDSWGDLIIYLNDPQACTIAQGDDEVACSYEDFTADELSWGYGCPSFQFVAAETGEYSLSIRSWTREEESREVGYSLVVLVNGQDTTMNLASDNGPSVEISFHSTIDISGEALITP